MKCVNGHKMMVSKNGDARYLLSDKNESLDCEMVEQAPKNAETLTPTVIQANPYKDNKENE